MLHTTLINEVLTTVAVDIIRQRRCQLPTMVLYVYDHISSQPPIARTCSDLHSYKENFSEHLACYIYNNTSSYYLAMNFAVALDHSYSSPAPVISQKLTKP